MLEELLEVGTKLFEASDRLQQAGEKRRKCIADYLLSIEKCLRDSVEQLNNGQVPNGTWGELRVYARKLSNTVGKEIGTDTAEELSLLLLSTAKNIPTDQDIPSIEAAAGKFKGLANTITTRQNSDSSTRRKILAYTTVGAAGLVGGLLLHQALSPNSTDNKSSVNGKSTGEDEFPSVSWNMHTFLGDSVRKTIIFDAPQQVCDRVRKMTKDRFNITLKRTGETTEEILQKISDGVIACGYGGIYYSTQKYKSLFFGCAIPFGLRPQEQTAWLNYKKNPDDELTFMQSIYKDKLNLNVIPFPAGATGGQMGGWFNAKLNSLDDLRGKVMRIPGLGADVLQKLGMTTHEHLGQTISMDEAIRRLEDGRFLAVEWTSPYDDLQLGLDKAAKFYYYPGWWEPSTTFDVQVNTDEWKKLPSNYQEIFKLACHETYTSILTDYDQKNSLALKEIQQKDKDKDIELLRFSNDILKAAKEQTNKILDLYAENDDVFNEVYDEWRSFKEKMRVWSDLNKLE
jgi:TRAP-type mannitol/chloroaromatic compound transport system substrate-binding protein